MPVGKLHGRVVAIALRTAAQHGFAPGSGNPLWSTESSLLTSVQDSFGPTSVLLDSAILFAPVGDIVPAALTALGRDGTLAIAGST